MKAAAMSRLWRTLRWVALAECLFRAGAGGLCLFLDYPEASRHVWIGCALAGGIRLLSKYLSANTLLFVLGIDWLIHFRGLVLLFGWTAGFQLNMLCLTFAVFMFEHVSLRLRIGLALVPFIGLFFILPHTYNLPPIYVLPERTLVGLFIANTTVFLVTTCLIIIYFARGVLGRELFARQQAEMRARLVADLSHELKTPLAAILTRTQVALSRERDPAKDEEVFRLVERNARGMTKLTRRMLDLSQLESGAQPLEITSVQPATLLEECVEQHRFLTEEKNVQLKIIDHGPDTIQTDAELLRIAVNNLLANAIRHSPADGTVALTCERNARECSIAVRDEGSGIDEQHLPHLFDPFYRGDAGRTRGQENHGLGLSITHRVMAQLGGSIDVESTPGRGSIFTLRLPL